MNKRDSILGTALTRQIGSSGQTSPCPTTEEIATLVDGTAEKGERARLLGHLAECQACRQLFVAASELSQEQPAAGEGRRYALPALLATAATILIALTLTFTMGGTGTNPVRVAQREAGNRVTASTGGRPAASETAENPSPTPSPVPAAPPMLPAAPAEPLVLLSAREAALPGSRNFGFATTAPQDGPTIAVENLEGEEGKPFPLTVAFIPKEGHPVNVTTLKLECLKVSPIDLTSRIQPYASAEGIKIDRVSLPSGSYRFRVSIGDVNGRFSEKEFTLNVGGTF